MHQIDLNDICFNFKINYKRVLVNMAAALRATLSIFGKAVNLSRSAMTRAVVLEKIKDIRIRDIDISEPFGPRDLRIDIRSVGICGSDVHYYQVPSCPTRSL